MTRRLRMPKGSISAYGGVACGVWAVPLFGCGDLIGVGSLTGDGAAPVTVTAGDEGIDATRGDVGVDAVAADVGVGADAGRESNDGAETTACASDSSVRWVSWSDPAAPLNAFYVGLEPMEESDPDAGSYYYYVCRARDADDAGDVIPGMFVDSVGCFYTPDGVQQYQSSSYDVLIDPNDCLAWTPYDGGLASALVGGQLAQAPLYVCSAPRNPLGQWWQAGYIAGAGCRFPTRGGTPQDVATDVFTVGAQ